MDKLIITCQNHVVRTALAREGKILQISLEASQEKSMLNSIYIGRVQNIVKNINAAFVDIGDGIVGYYNLSENHRHWYGNGTCGTKLHPGDQIIVQVSKEAVKTKAPVLTGKLALTGKLTVLTIGAQGIGFSNKITDRKWKEELRPILQREVGEEFGLIIRTNGKGASADELAAEIRGLRKLFCKLLETAPYRSCHSRLYQAPSSFLANIRNAYAEQLGEIITDDPQLFEEIRGFLTQEQPEDLEKLRFYQDPLLSLGKLYQLEQVICRALEKRVWLKSGGYLVIEPTEALVVIDVNTGKYSGKKTMQETILKINLEAAEEIGRQLRLRNLSGMIIVDFIDMAAEEDRRLLLEHLMAVVSMDPVKTVVVDYTRLNLVEMTRKKIHRPLHEQVENLQPESYPKK